MVVAMRMPSNFSISSRMMFWMAFSVCATLLEPLALLMFWRLLNSASASLKSRMGFCFSFSQSLR